MLLTKNIFSVRSEEKYSRILIYLGSGKNLGLKGKMVQEKHLW